MKKFSNIVEILLDFFEITIIGVTIFLVVYLFVGQLLEVTGDSMTPTLVDQEQIIAEKLSKMFKPLERGEIVVFRHPENHKRLLIKRIIGLPGENIMISNGQIFIDGNELTETYTKYGSYTQGKKELQEDLEYKIPGNSYVLMGDNRDESSDSRVFGAVQEGLIVGRALLVYYPLSNIRFVQH